MAVRGLAWVGGGRLRSTPDLPALDDPVPAPPRYDWGKNRTEIDRLLGKFRRHGEVEFPDPYVDGAVYRIEYGKNDCPNISLCWKITPGGRFNGACITCDGFPCEVCSKAEGDDRWSLFRAVVGAVFAGRQVAGMGSNHVISSDGSWRSRQEVLVHRKRPEGEEARDGRPEEPEAPGAEALLTVPVFASRPVGTLQLVTDDGGQFIIRVCDGEGNAIKDLTVDEAWVVLRDAPGGRYYVLDNFSIANEEF